MQNIDTIIFYELPPYCVPNTILPSYAIMDSVWDSTAELVHNPTYENNTNALKESMVNWNPKDIFGLTFLDCVVMGQMLNFIELYYEKILLPKTKSVYPFTVKEKAHKEQLDGMMEQISSIIEDIYTLIPTMDRSICDDPIIIKLFINCIKTLGLDKEKEVARLHFKEEREIVSIIKISFAFFDRFIIAGDSDFSARVLGANFCCSADIKEVTALYNISVEKAKLDETYEMKLSLRDVVVLLMVNNIWQKCYFSDGGDEVHSIIENCLTKGGNATMEQMREFLLVNARALDKHLTSQAHDAEGFKEAMKPIYDFAVEV